MIPIDLPEVYLELCCCNMAATGSRIGIMKETYVPFDPADYDGTLQCWFEISVQNWSGWGRSFPITTFLSLVNAITGTAYATISIPPKADPVDWKWQTYRVAFTPPAGAVTFALFMPSMGDDYGSWVEVATARVRIRQTGATKSRIQWPMLEFGAYFSTGYEYVANSIPLRNCPAYTTDWNNSNGESIEHLPIQKYRVEDLDPVSAVEFRVLPGKHPPTQQGNCFIPNGGLTFFLPINFDLWYSDDGGVTKIMIAGTHHDFDPAVDPFPWIFSDVLDPTIFGVAGREIYTRAWVGMGATWYLWATLPLIGTTFTDAIFSGYTTALPGEEHDSIFFEFIDLIADDSQTEGLSVAVFDRDTNLMITGCELSWVKGEIFDWKSTSVNPAAFTSGHELEVRCKSPATGGYYTSPYLGEAQLFFSVDPIHCFTSWQRVGEGTHYVIGYTDYPPGYGSVYDDFGEGCVSAYARLQYYEVPNAVVNYQACASAFAWPTEQYPYEHGYDEYEYFALWNDALNDLDITAGSNRVDESMLNWTDPPDYGPDDQHRTMKRTPDDISQYLVDGNRYCNLQPDDQFWLFPIDAFLVCTICTENVGWVVGEPCVFLFTEVPVIPCNDLPCTTPLCVPTATLEQYQGSLTAVAGPTARIK